MWKERLMKESTGFVEGAEAWASPSFQIKWTYYQYSMLTLPRPKLDLSYILKAQSDQTTSFWSISKQTRKEYDR